MIKDSGKNLGFKFHGVSLSIYCSLMLTSLVAGRSRVQLAAMGGAADRIQSGALAAIEAEGTEETMSANGARMLGLGGQPFAVKQLHVRAAGEKRGADAFTVNGRDYLLFSRLSGEDNWFFLYERDSEVLQKSFHGRVHAGIQEIPESQALPLAAAERGFWLQWLASTISNKKRSSSRTAGRS